MATIADIIAGAREQFPDNPANQVAASSITAGGSLQPNLPGANLTATGSGGSLPAVATYLICTWYNASGETIGSNEVIVTPTAGQVIKVLFTLPPGASGIRVYMGYSAGGENQYFQSTTNPFNITASGGVASVPPVNNTAFNPDSDGNVVGVATVYRWLNDALGKAALAAGGINDITGVSTVNGQGRYTLINKWTKFTNCWFDGWLMAMLDNGNFYYHNTGTGIAWMITMQQVTTRNVFEINPQANRTAGTATVASQVGIADNAVNLTGESGFVLPLGLALLGTPSAGEMISYDQVTQATQSSPYTALNSCVRGVGGTIPQVWPATTPVTELNLRLHGSRMPVYYPVGSSLVTLDIPYNWEENIKSYMVGMFREMEQEDAKAQRLKKEFMDWTKDLARQNRQMMGPVQVGVAGGRDVAGGGMGGGWFVS